MRGDAKILVLMLYQNARCGKRALAAYDGLVQQLGREYDFSSEFCTFEALGRKVARTRLMNNSREAGLVVVCAEDERRLPAHTRRWLEGWLDQNGKESRALMLLDEQPESRKAAATPCASLPNLAAKRGVKAFRDAAGLLPGKCRMTLDRKPVQARRQSFIDWILTAVVPATLQPA